MSTRLPVAVDAMGGDDAPVSIVAGARIASEELGVPVLLVGDTERMGDVGDLPVKHASEVIDMGDEPAASVRRKKDASVVRAAEAVRDGEAVACLSAGNTGAAMASSLLRLGRIRGINRPAIAVPFPVLGSTPTTLLDCGANADAQPEWLVQFAQLGSVYARTRFGVETPRVAVMTIGEEAGKGNALVKDACELMAEESWTEACGATFVGNVEGRDLMAGVADVIVCDGFTGNIILKSLEGGVGIALDAIRRRLGAIPGANESLADLYDELDPESRGAAMLLGCKQVSMISHGSSSPRAIANAIRTASEMADSGIVANIRAMLEAEKATD
jgi:glycerol-3-phosphate acyltransferase PlsX